MFPIFSSWLSLFLRGLRKRLVIEKARTFQRERGNEKFVSLLIPALTFPENEPTGHMKLTAHPIHTNQPGGEGDKIVSIIST